MGTECGERTKQDVKVFRKVFPAWELGAVAELQEVTGAAVREGQGLAKYLYLGRNTWERTLVSSLP